MNPKRPLVESERWQAGFLGACAVAYVLAECGGKVICAGTDYGCAGGMVKLGDIDSLRFEKPRMKYAGIKALLTWPKAHLWSSPVAPGSLPRRFSQGRGVE